MAVACPVDLDTGRLRHEIQAIYARVATDPSSEFHFHRGPAYAAERLGYDASATVLGDIGFGPIRITEYFDPFGGTSKERVARKYGVAAVYPATWGVAQLATGALSDRTGRKPLIVWGMWIQAIGIAVVTLGHTFATFVAGAVLLGIGTAMVYPTLLAAIGDVAHPSWRASAVGVYRLWRDLGYAVGALLAGLTADAFGIQAAMWLIAFLTMASGAVSAVRMAETLPMSPRAIAKGDLESAIASGE